MGGEMKRLQTSASPATAAAAGQWVPLRRHPVSSPAASLPTEHPTNLLAWNSSASLLYLWDAPKSAPHAPVSIEAAAASKVFAVFVLLRSPLSCLPVCVAFGELIVGFVGFRFQILFPDVRLQISVLNVAMNRAGTCVAICGANGLYVIYLYNRTASGSATCRTGCVGLQLYVGEQNFVHILQVSWHSHRDMHLGVLSVGLIPRPIWRQSVTCIEGNGKALIHELAFGLREARELVASPFWGPKGPTLSSDSVFK